MDALFLSLDSDDSGIHIYIIISGQSVFFNYCIRSTLLEKEALLGTQFCFDSTSVSN